MIESVQERLSDSLRVMQIVRAWMHPSLSEIRVQTLTRETTLVSLKEEASELHPKAGVSFISFVLISPTCTLQRAGLPLLGSPGFVSSCSMAGMPGVGGRRSLWLTCHCYGSQVT